MSRPESNETQTRTRPWIVVEEWKWIAVFSLTLMILWGLPLYLRLPFIIPFSIFMHVFAEESGYYLVTKRLVFAGIVSLVIMFTFGG